MFSRRTLLISGATIAGIAFAVFGRGDFSKEESKAPPGPEFLRAQQVYSARKNMETALAAFEVNGNAITDSNKTKWSVVHSYVNIGSSFEISLGSEIFSAARKGADDTEEIQIGLKGSIYIRVEGRDKLLGKENPGPGEPEISRDDWKVIGRIQDTFRAAVTEFLGDNDGVNFFLEEGEKTRRSLGSKIDFMAGLTADMLNVLTPDQSWTSFSHIDLEKNDLPINNETSGMCFVAEDINDIPLQTRKRYCRVKLEVGQPAFWSVTATPGVAYFNFKPDGSFEDEKQAEKSKGIKTSTGELVATRSQNLVRIVREGATPIINAAPN